MSRPSSSRSDRSPTLGGVDVYLLPAVVGGGFGDIAEVLDAGRAVVRAGHSVRLLRLPGRPLPPGVDGPWDWPPVERGERPTPSGTSALTLSPCFGLAAAPGHPGALGRPGPWADEVAAIERAYGPDRTVHVSLEEFARTFSPRAENRERLREGGLSREEAGRRARGAPGERDTERWRTAFRRYRALDRPNVLHLVGTFQVARAFHRAFPEMVQAGPLWPGTYSAAAIRPGARGPATILWYASPSSSALLFDDVREGLAAADPSGVLSVRFPHGRPPAAGPGPRVEALSPMPMRLWRSRFAGATLRIVTGSRSLLEAIELGRPFLYFNGVLSPHGRRRRHRPEKALQLLELFRRLGVPERVRRDLAAFSRGERVSEVVARAVADPTWRRAFPAFRRVPPALPEPIDAILRRVLDRLDRGETGAPELVADERARGAGARVS